jgi:hypothetical protein
MGQKREEIFAKDEKHQFILSAKLSQVNEKSGKRERESPAEHAQPATATTCPSLAQLDKLGFLLFGIPSQPRRH